MWIDKGMYWAWAGGEEGFTPPPWKKTPVYATWPSMRLCVGVHEHGGVTPLHQDELAWLTCHLGPPVCA